MLKKFARLLSPVVFIALALIFMPKIGAASPNLIANPSVETISGSLPASWSQDQWGTNTETFSYTSTGAHSGTRSLYMNMTKWTSGDAKWYFADVAVQPNHKYTYSEFYKSNVVTETDIQYTSTTNRLTYGYLNSPAASPTAWNSSTVTFTTPANVKSLTIFHLLDKVGWLQTDDFSLVDPSVAPPSATPPTVSFSAPVSGATVSGKTLSVSANAIGTTPVAGVQFKLDNNNLGAEDTTAPYSVNWDTTASVNGSHTLTATARDTTGLLATATETVTVNNVVSPPSVSITAPAAGATINGTQAISANASDAVSLAGVQFKVDGTNVGTEDTAAPYTINWDTKTVSNGNHVLSATARNSKGLTSTASETVSVQNVTPPTVSFSAPVSGATVSGKTLSVSANAIGTTPVAGVQFKLDNNNLGAEDTTAPYSVNWDTTASVNGSHTLTATARDTTGLLATATETVTVNNVVSPPPVTTNLITNPSFETSTNGTSPDNWLSSNWGTNTSTFSYLNTGHTGTRSVKVQTTAYTNGAANWYYANIPVTPGKTYKYENWYQSNVDTEVDAQVLMNDGTTQYNWIGAVLANPAWTKFSSTFTVPAGAKSLAMYQILAKNGYIVSDDYSLSAYTPLPLTRGLVSVTFDDGWTNQYLNAFPVLKKYGLQGTFYIISGSLTDQPDYMSSAQVQSLQAAGNEIGSHTITHSDLTTLTQAQMVNELAQSQTTLQNLLGVLVTDFAYPYGAYNAATIAAGKQYYQSQRTVNGGLNTKDNFDITLLKIQEVDSNISQAQVQGWIQAAITQKSWLILVYHETAVTPTDPTDVLYDTQPSDLDAEMAYLKGTGVGVVTVHQAINEILPQLQ